jgi:outer membrane protein TolC
MWIVRLALPRPYTFIVFSLALLPPIIPSGLPAELLARRPYIVEVERYVAAANSEIGIAKTAGLPNLSLTGLAGFESTNLTSLFSWRSSLASLGASALMPVFTGGRVKAGVDQALAVYRQSLAQFQKTVLTAYQEVEDQLAALRKLAGEPLPERLGQVPRCRLRTNRPPGEPADRNANLRPPHGRDRGLDQGLGGRLA